MELRLLEYFLATAREQSITAAAESLHLSQPALSTQLKNLEKELGKQLLIRGTKGSRRVLLTEEGMILRKRAQEILSLVSRTEEEIGAAEEAVIGDVYIGAGETQVVRIFAEAAKSLHEKYPQIRYHIASGNAEYVLEYLDKGLIDFGLLFCPVDPAKYEALTVPHQDTWGVLMRRDAPLAQKEVIRPQDLAGQPLILSHQRGGNETFAEWIGEEKMQVVATYNLLYNASLLVEAGLGYAVGFDKLINTEGSDLCFRPLFPSLYAQSRIIWKRDQMFSRPVSIFLKYLREWLEKEENADQDGYGF